MHNIERMPIRLSSYPYLLAAVLLAAVDHAKDPGGLASKAHRLINKVSYRHEHLDQVAQAAFGTEVNAYLGIDTFTTFFSLAELICCHAPLYRELAAVEAKNPDFGKLCDFINHVLSVEE